MPWPAENRDHSRLQAAVCGKGLLASRNLDFRKVPTNPRNNERVPVSKLFVQAVWLMLITCFPFGGWDLGMCNAAGAYMTGPPIKTQGLSLRQASLVYISQLFVEGI